MPDYEGGLRLWRQEMKLAVVPQAAPHVTIHHCQSQRRMDKQDGQKQTVCVTDMKGSEIALN